MFDIRRHAGIQGTLPFNYTHHILTSKSAVLDPMSAVGMTEPVNIQATSLFVGDPVSPQRTILNLSYLGTMPDGSGGYITVGGPGSDVDCRLHLRSMMLTGLQPASLNASSNDTISKDLSGFTSLLWIFNINRLDGSGYGLLTVGAIVLKR